MVVAVNLVPTPCSKFLLKKFQYSGIDSEGYRNEVLGSGSYNHINTSGDGLKSKS